MIRCGKQAEYIKVQPRDMKCLYGGQEVAAHTLTHSRLTNLDKEEVIRQVEKERLNLSKLVDYDVCKMAYPCGGVNNNRYVADIIRENTLLYK